MRTIREIKAELSALRDEYERAVRALNDEADRIRSARGFKPKVRPFEEYYEQGRSRMPTPSGGMGC